MQQQWNVVMTIVYDVYYYIIFPVPPTVELTLGRMVNPEDLEEGDDIYFSCSINANPPAYKLTWWHNVSS